MKKATLTTIYETLKTMDYDPEILAEVETELNRGAEKAQANKEMYDAAKPVVFAALSDTPVTISELYAEVEDNLPDGMTKGKLQYAITRLWKDEVGKVEGKINSYTRK